MRTTASWFGSLEIHRIQVCYAMIRVSRRAPLGSFEPQSDHGQYPAVLASINDKPAAALKKRRH